MGIEMIGENKKAQVTIFVIIAIIIVAAVLLFLILRTNREPRTSVNPDENPSSFLSLCLSDSIKEGIELIGKQGDIEPVHYKPFKFSDEQETTNIAYLCYNRNYYFPCINEKPLLIQTAKEELSDYISSDVRNCFNNLGADREKAGYVVESRYNGFQLNFRDDSVEVVLDAQMVLTKSDETSIQKNMKVVVPSNFYGLLRLANEIVDQEAKFCSFESLGYQLLYPDWKIEKIKTSDSVKIYTLLNKESKEMFRFAVRGCVFPPGF